MPPSLACAATCPCAAASPSSRLASAKSGGAPSPWKCMLPSALCASAFPCAAASPYSRLASVKSCSPPWPLQRKATPRRSICSAA
eukprot:scaffold32784_cov69-Phaeocystis_antarctica.AAC.9